MDALSDPTHRPSRGTLARLHTEQVRTQHRRPIMLIRRLQSSSRGRPPDSEVPTRLEVYRGKAVLSTILAVPRVSSGTAKAQRRCAHLLRRRELLRRAGAAASDCVLAAARQPSTGQAYKMHRREHACDAGQLVSSSLLSALHCPAACRDIDGSRARGQCPCLHGSPQSCMLAHACIFASSEAVGATPRDLRNLPAACNWTWDAAQGQLKLVIHGKP